MADIISPAQRSEEEMHAASHAQERSSESQPDELQSENTLHVIRSLSLQVSSSGSSTNNDDFIPQQPQPIQSSNGFAVYDYHAAYSESQSQPKLAPLCQPSLRNTNSSTTQNSIATPAQSTSDSPKLCIYLPTHMTPANYNRGETPGQLEHDCDTVALCYLVSLLTRVQFLCVVDGLVKMFSIVLFYHFYKLFFLAFPLFGYLAMDTLSKGWIGTYGIIALLDIGRLLYCIYTTIHQGEIVMFDNIDVVILVVSLYYIKKAVDFLVSCTREDIEAFRLMFHDRSFDGSTIVV